jgi:hypothetical protein
MHLILHTSFKAFFQQSEDSEIDRASCHLRFVESVVLNNDAKNFFRRLESLRYLFIEKTRFQLPCSDIFGGHLKNLQCLVICKSSLEDQAVANELSFDGLDDAN